MQGREAAIQIVARVVADDDDGELGQGSGQWPVASGRAMGPRGHRVSDEQFLCVLDSDVSQISVASVVAASSSTARVSRAARSKV